MAAEEHKYGYYVYGFSMKVNNNKKDELEAFVREMAAEMFPTVTKWPAEGLNGMWKINFGIMHYYDERLARQTNNRFALSEIIGQMFKDVNPSNVAVKVKKTVKAIERQLPNVFSTHVGRQMLVEVTSEARMLPIVEPLLSNEDEEILGFMLTPEFKESMLLLEAIAKDSFEYDADRERFVTFMS